MSPKGEEAKPQPNFIHIQARHMSPKGEEAKPQPNFIHIQAR